MNRKINDGELQLTCPWWVFTPWSSTLQFPSMRRVLTGTLPHKKQKQQIITSKNHSLPHEIGNTPYNITLSIPLHPIKLQSWMYRLWIIDRLEPIALTNWFPIELQYFVKILREQPHWKWNYEYRKLPRHLEASSYNRPKFETQEQNISCGCMISQSSFAHTSPSTLHEPPSTSSFSPVSTTISSSKFNQLPESLFFLLNQFHSKTKMPR